MQRILRIGTCFYQMPMIKKIEAKTILSRLKFAPDKYFGITYSMNLYRGCYHGCIYCDSRSKCYQMEDLSTIIIKTNALSLLENELSKKRKRGTIGSGSMNDAYMPIEKETELMRQAIKIINRYKFPLHIITKSDMVIRDIDILKITSKTYAAISFTITTINDNLSKIIEPNAPSTTKRLSAIESLSKNNIYTGITLMPVLPYLTDKIDNIKEIVKRGKDCGAQYILPSFGLTQREGQREYFYSKLNQYFPGLKEKYEREFGSLYNCFPKNYQKLYEVFFEECERLSMKTRMTFFAEAEKPYVKQLKLFD